MTLIIAKSFDNKREAMQGYHRVGRFGDKCLRVIFKDNPLIDTKALATYKMNAFKFVSAMAKKPVIMKPITVKEIVIPDNKPNAVAVAKSAPYSSMGRKRVNALLSTSHDGMK